MSVVPTDAQSRIEKLLSDLLNENTSDISPQSRNEAFLLGLINKVVPDITPVSRVECYLKALCEKNAGSGGGGGGSGGGGGGSSSVSPNDVNFYDYDGTIVASYSLSEAQGLTTLPDGPTHDGLTFQGWNYTLEKVKAFTRPMNVGAMYITDDGKTRLHIRIAAEGRMNVPLYISQTVTNGVTIDWGDGSATETLAGTGNVNTTHTYASIGDYVITLDPVDECTLGLGSNSSSYCVMGSTGNNGIVYCNMLQDVQVGIGVISIGSFAFQNCYLLASITIPDGVTSIDTYAFPNCYSLASITIPDGVTSINNSAFQNCYSLASITIPDDVTSIGTYVFQNCRSLASITIPDGVTSIGTYTFQNCYGMAEYHLKPTTPPTLSNTNVFTNIPSDCIIYVPQGCLKAYQNATNWTAYKSKMREEPA